MFSILKLIIWLAGVITIASFALPYFGYALNMNYWTESKSVCQEKLNQCQRDVIKTGLNGAKETCDWKCVDPSLIIKKHDGKDDIL
jgi:hypothetical protein